MRVRRVIVGLGLILTIVAAGVGGVFLLTRGDTSSPAYAENLQGTPMPPTPTSTDTPRASLVSPTLTATQAASPSPSAVPSVRLAVVGDLMMARSVNRECIRQDDFTWPFHETASILRDADLTIGNLETPLVTGCIPTDFGMRFCADPRTVDGLVFAGFDVVSLANNHVLNYEQEGLDETFRLLSAAQIVGLPHGALVVYEINGMSVGIIAYDDTDWLLPIDETLAEVEKIAGQVDALIGYFHWGFENQPNASHYQQDFSKQLIDAGMDVVIGAHPHWLQPIERYKEGVVFYSLGNFVADQMSFRRSMESVIVRLTLERHPERLQIDYELIPMKLVDVGQPRPVTCPAKYACDFVPTLDPTLP
ncbi:MAG: CapA family protein [Anaerolineae bacterium]|nr:CapA family protein [Anaerolineae bacterium]